MPLAIGIPQVYLSCLLGCEKELLVRRQGTACNYPKSALQSNRGTKLFCLWKCPNHWLVWDGRYWMDQKLPYRRTKALSSRARAFVACIGQHCYFGDSEVPGPKTFFFRCFSRPLYFKACPFRIRVQPSSTDPSWSPAFTLRSERQMADLMEVAFQR